MYAISRSRGLPSADIFRTVVIQMRTSALFVAKTNIEFFKIYSVSTSDMDRDQFFMILCIRPYGWSLSKKTAKLSMGYRPTNSNSNTIDSLYRVCITNKESMVIGYHDHLWLLNLMAVRVLWVLFGKILLLLFVYFRHKCIVYIFFHPHYLACYQVSWYQDTSSQYLYSLHTYSCKYTDNST